MRRPSPQPPHPNRRRDLPSPPDRCLRPPPLPEIPRASPPTRALICQSSLIPSLKVMSAPQSLLQAAVNRFVARVGSGLAETAATLAVLAQDAPQRLREEFNLFWEEVEQEAERLDREQKSTPASESTSEHPHEPLRPAGSDRLLESQGGRSFQKDGAMNWHHSLVQNNPAINQPETGRHQLHCPVFFVRSG